MPIEETTILTRGIEEILPLLEQLGKKASTVTSFEDAKALYELIRQVDWSHVQQVFDTTKLPDFQAESYTKGLQRAG